MTLAAMRRYSACVAAAFTCGFNRWKQNTRNCVSRRSVADEATATDLLHGKPEGAHVGALAERRFSPADCPASLIETTRRCRAFWCRRVGYVPRHDTARDWR